jgi:hypothetical protein
MCAAPDIPRPVNTGRASSRQPFESNPTNPRHARRWHKAVKDVRDRAGKFLRTHPSEDLEPALKAREVAAGSFEEVAEHYE